MKIKKFKTLTEKLDFNSNNDVEYGLYGKRDDKSYWLLQKFNNLEYAISYYKKSVTEKNGEFIYGMNYYTEMILLKETKIYETLDLDLLLNITKYNL